MTVSEWCQIITALVATISLTTNALIRYRDYFYSTAKFVSTWIEDKNTTDNYTDKYSHQIIISNQSKTTLYNVFVFMDLNIYECSLPEHLDRINKFNNPYFY